MSKPTVSVVVPVYNALPYLTELLDSLAAQDIEAGSLEVVAVDDGSTDGSGEVLDDYCRRHERFSVIHQTNSRRPGRPRNVGLRASEGLLTLESRSILDPQRVESSPGFFAALPYGLLHVVIVALDLVALWVIAGRSWIRAGLLFWFPLVISEVASGQLNILVAGAIVEAQRGRVWPLAIMSWAKLWPALALPPRRWRPFLIAVLAFALISLPWPYLYPEWVAALIGNIADPEAPLVPVPFLLRLPVALVLIAIQRPWTRALGAMLASPNLYWGQLVVVIAPISLWIQERTARAPTVPATGGDVAAPSPAA